MSKKKIKVETASLECGLEENGEVSIEISGTGISVAIIMIECLKSLQHDGVPVMDIAMIAHLAAKDEDYYSLVKEFYHEYGHHGASLAAAMELELLKETPKFKLEEESKK